MKIIFVRHGETDWNAQLRYQGHCDITLNDRGRGDAFKLAALLAKENVEAIYSSDLSRTRETAEIIAASLKLEVNSEPRLRELCFGEWEGKTFSEAYRDYQDEFKQWYENTMEFQVPGGESFTQLLERSWQAMTDVAERHQGTVLIVSHGGVIKTLLYKLKAISHEEFWGKNFKPGSMVSLSFDGNDVKVLDKLNLEEGIK